MKKYVSKGFVYGNLWGGGKAAYPARRLEADTKKGLMEQAKQGLDGSLDSGKGFISLTGAILETTKISFVKIKGKEYSNKENYIEFVGKLTRKEREFLEECLYDM